MSYESNEAEVFSRPNKTAVIHDFEQFTLWTDTPDRPSYRARMTFGERNGAARISVFPNFESGPKVLYVGMSPTIFLEFLARFKAVIDGPAGGRDKIDNLDRDPTAERTEDIDKVRKVVRNTLFFGKSDSGICWISIDQPNVPRVVFKITSSVWHHFYKPDGSVVTPEEGSAAQATALVEALRIAMSPYIARIRAPFEKQPGKQDFAGKKGGSSPTTLSTFPDDDINY